MLIKFIPGERAYSVSFIFNILAIETSLVESYRIIFNNIAKESAKPIYSPTRRRRSGCHWLLFKRYINFSSRNS